MILGLLLVVVAVFCFMLLFSGQCFIFFFSDSQFICFLVSVLLSSATLQFLCDMGFLHSLVVCCFFCCLLVVLALIADS